MTEVRIDPQQAPARAELLLGAFRTRRLAATLRELPVLAGPNGGRTGDAVLDECGAVQALPGKSAGDLARIDGVTPRTRPRSARRSPRRETIANPSAAPASSPPRAAL